MTRALAEGTEDARLFLHAAVIAAADGRPADAARWQRKASTLRFTLLPSELGVLRTGIVTHPRYEVIAMKNTALRAAADRCSGIAATAPPGARIQPHGCAAHHAGRCGEHDRRLRVRLPAVRPQVPDHGARRVPARGARHRPEQIQLRRRRALRDPRRHRQRRGAGRTTHAYQFKFDTTFRNRNTILQSYLGVIDNVGDASQNLIQRYTRRRRSTGGPGGPRVSVAGIVPPNNQGNATPRYNRNDDGEQPAQGRRRRRGRSRSSTRRSRSPSSQTAISPSPASATTGSTPTSRRCSTC